MVTLLYLKKVQEMEVPREFILLPLTSAALHWLREEGVGTVLLRQDTVEFLEVVNLNCNSVLWPPNPSLQKCMQIYRKFPVSRAFSTFIVSFDVQKAF